MSAADIISSFALAVSLCADCFAVSSCSSVTLRDLSWRKVMPIALAFGIIQTLLMFLGWLFGDLFVGFVEKAAGIIGFLLLLYVGGSMILEALRGKAEARNLNGIRNVIIGGVATSIDAFAVGISMSMEHCATEKALLDLVAVFIITILSVIVGMSGGSRIGSKCGKPAEIIGGIILILIGINIIFA